MNAFSLNGAVSLRKYGLFATVILLAGLAGGCGQERSMQTSTRPAVEDPVATNGSRAVGSAGDEIDLKRAQLLQRIRSADPKKETIERAVINANNELGLILAHGTQMDDIPKLMRAMLAQLDETFPGQDQTVVAYAPSSPPKKIGTGRLDSRTRDMTYTPEKP